MTDRHTEILQVNADSPDSGAIARAADLLRADELVAFPTETVYGLGANALDAAAVAGIYAAKGRPSHNPLIVHVPDADAARALVTDWPESAQRLVERFWPGPLTLVLPRGPQIPDIVTGGGPTVGVRVPAHPVALALLRAVRIPIAAPSANRSLELSPTRAEHVARGLSGRIALILDGGPTSGGLESTVLDLTAQPPRLLRPGLITPGEIEAVLGPIVRNPAPSASGALLSPGMLARHYAPRAPLELAADSGEARVTALLAEGARVGWLTFQSPPDNLSSALVALQMPADPILYAAQLYAALHTLDESGVTRIVVANLPEGEGWLAIRDRLQRAATPE